MCGDGANDCTALKSADVGLSLSETEASIAAPFTSKKAEIYPTITLLRQGRASLDLSYNLFRFVLMTSAIQFSSMSILHYSTSTLDDAQFGYIGVVILTPMIFMICTMEASSTLVPYLPFKSILDKSILLSIVGHALINIGAQIGAYFAVRGEDYFEAVTKSHDLDTDGYEVTTMFLVSAPQYIYIGIIISIFTPFRVPIYKSIFYMLILFGMLGLTYWVILHPEGFMRDFLNLKRLDKSFRAQIAGITVIAGICDFIYEVALNFLFGNSEPQKIPDAENVNQSNI